MPKVPVYDQQLVSASPLSLPRAPGVSQSAALVAGSIQRATGDIANVLTQLGQQARQDTMRTALTDLDNQFSEIGRALLLNPETGYSFKSGLEAAEESDAVLEDYRKRTEEVLSSLGGGPELRESARLRANERREEFALQVQRHQFSEIKRAELQTHQDMQAEFIADMQTAAVASDDSLMDRSVERAREAFYGFYGFDDESDTSGAQDKKVVDDNWGRVLSEAYAGSVMTLLDAQAPAAARALYEAKKEFISGGDAAPIIKALAPAEAKQRAIIELRKIIPEPLRGPVDWQRVQAMREAVRALAPVDRDADPVAAELHDATSARLETEIAQWKDGWALENQAAMNTAMRSVLAGQEVAPSVEVKLDGQQLRTLAEMKSGERVTQWAEIYPQIRGLTPQQWKDLNLVNFLGQVSETDFKTLMSLQREAERALAGKDTVFSAEQWLSNFQRSMGDLEKEDQGRFWLEAAGSVMRLYAAAEQSGRPVTDEDLRKTIAPHYTKVYQQSVGLVGAVGNFLTGTKLFTSERERRLADIPPEERGTDIRVPIEKIPADLQSMLRNWISSHGEGSAQGGKATTGDIERNYHLWQTGRLQDFDAALRIERGEVPEPKDDLVVDVSANPLLSSIPKADLDQIIAMHGNVTPTVESIYTTYWRAKADEIVLEHGLGLLPGEERRQVEARRSELVGAGKMADAEERAATMRRLRYYALLQLGLDDPKARALLGIPGPPPVAP